MYKDDEPLPRPANKSLSEGLLGVNSYLFGRNKYGIQEIAEDNMGIRMYEYVGLELVAISKGNHITHISNLSPQDHATGNILLEESGMVASGLFGTPLTFGKREYYLVRTSCIYAEIINLLKEED